MHRIFEKLNVDATELFFDMDGTFPNHHPDPTVPANLEDLADAVRMKRAELGIAFDGDADRIGAIDENGNVVYGDMLMLIYGRLDPHAQTRPHFHRRSEMLAGDVRRAEKGRRQPHHV